MKMSAWGGGCGAGEGDYDPGRIADKEKGRYRTPRQERARGDLERQEKARV